jgi:DNA-binding response OmpR family regulator
MKRILIAEDDLFLCQQYQEYLKEDQSLEVCIVSNAQAAVKKMLENPFHLYITDLEMPVMSGWDFFNHYDTQTIQTPILIISSCPLEKVRSLIPRYKYTDFLSKQTLSKKQLLDTIKALLAVPS